MSIVTICNKIISLSFYSLFFLVPLIFAGNTSELFELNKIWITYVLAIIISVSWITKMIVQRKFFLQRTPLNIFLLLFLLSQIISTIFSLDSYVSFWGYYSRFNGGLLSTITYLFLYYAFVSNLGKKQVFRILQVTLFSGLCVALWGLPSHFGYDPTCFVFRGDFDVSCWTDAFQPKVRIFSTLGQPDWLAAFLVAVIPIAIAFGLEKYQEARSKNQGRMQNYFLSIYYLLLTILFYVDLLFTRARSGFIAFWISIIVFFILYLWLHKDLIKKALLLTSCFLLLFYTITFFIGQPVSQLDKFTYAGFSRLLQTKTAPVKTGSTTITTAKKPAAPAGEFGGTDSGKIRLFVWRGALDVWKHYPLFGSGVETFAFAYYKFRPVGHNLTSEWDYLYNKAHNEFLNYLATTGIFGLGTYLLFIGIFFFLSLKYLPNAITVVTQNVKYKKFGVTQSTIDHKLLVIGLLSALIGTLITNFFGFSVVIMNLFLFLMPAFVLLLENKIGVEKMFIFPNIATSTVKSGMTRKDGESLTVWQYLPLTITALIAIYFLYTLLRFWQADTAYALGTNYDHAGYYQNANQLLHSAVEQRPDEPVFVDELSSNDAVIAGALAEKKDSTNAAKFAQKAVNLSNQTVQNHPNNIIFWKTRVRVFYSLAQIDPQYLRYALQSIQQANELAPTDAKISYNLGLLYSQTGDITKAVSVMENTVKLKPDYRDAYYALGLFYHQAAMDKDGKAIVNQDLQQKAVNTMQYILFHFSPDDTGAKDSLKSWSEL